MNKSLLFAVSVTTLAAGSIASALAPLPVRFVDPVAQVRPGPDAGVSYLSLRFDAPTAEQKARKDELKFVDLDLPSTLAARVKSTVSDVTASNDIGRTWRIDLVIDGLQPGNSVQRRYAKITWGEDTWDLAYYLSNQAPTDFKWDVAGLPAEWNINRDRCASFRITQSALVSTGVTMAATLSDENSKQLLGPTTLYISSNPDTPNPSQQEIDAAANNGKSLYLCAKSEFFEDSPAHGKFIGTVTVASAQRPEGKTISIIAYKAGLQSLGVVLILVGSIAAYFIKVYAPARLSRSRELEPVVVMELEVKKLQEAVATIPSGKAPNVSDALNGLQSDMSVENLDLKSLIHRVPPLPFNDSVDAAGYAKLLSESASRIMLIDIIVNEGLLQAKTWEVKTPTEQGLIDVAYENMDKRLGQTPALTADQMRTQILSDLAKLTADISNALTGGREAAVVQVGDEEPRPQTFERLQLSIETLSGTIWFMWAALTAAAGIVFQVYMNLSFGRPADYLYCLLWGFGITAVGQQFTSNLVTTGVGVSLPKTN